MSLIRFMVFATDTWWYFNTDLLSSLMSTIMKLNLYVRFLKLGKYFLLVGLIWSNPKFSMFRHGWTGSEPRIENF